MFVARFLLAAALLAVPTLAFAQTPACPQLFAGGQPPALLNPKLGQRATLLCNAAYAVLASGITRGALWSAEHPTAASLDEARDTPREGQFHADDRLPPGDQARLEDYSLLGGRIVERERGRSEILRVPPALKHRDRLVGRG